MPEVQRGDACCANVAKTAFGALAMLKVLYVLTYGSLTFIAFFWGAPNVYWIAATAGAPPPPPR